MNSTERLAWLWLNDLDAQLRSCDYTGPDPYDALSSPALQRLRRPILRQIAVQGVKRSPLDLRRLAGVPPLRMAKTLGVVIGSLGIAPDLQSSRERREALRKDLSAAQQSDGGWGYEFDVQMRWGGYPKHESNVVATAFVVEGLHQAGLPVPNLERAVEFIAGPLDRGHFIAYAPASRTLIHNANLLGAATLELLAPGHPLVTRALTTCLEGQTARGTWPYGSDESTQWVDSFHTVYVLYCLRFLRSRYPPADEAYRRGLEAWLDLGFAPDGSPRYFLEGTAQRIDVHNIANSLAFLALLAPTIPQARTLIEPTLTALGSLRRPDGTFSTRSRGSAYVRWESAHAHRALALTSCLERDEHAN